MLSLILFGVVQQQFFPSSERPELLVDLRLAQNASIEATRAEVERFEKVLLADQDIVYHSFYVGSGAVRFYLPLNQQLENANFAQAVVLTRSYEVRDQVRARLEKVLAEDFPTLMARVEPLALGPPVDWPLQYRVSGPDIGGVRAMAEKVAATMRANPNTRVVNFDWNEMTKSMRIVVDQDKARQLGISSEQVARSLNAALSGRTVTQLRDDIYLIDVQGRAEARDRSDLSRLRDLEIGIVSGNSVPLAQIARFEYGLEETIIWRRDRLADHHGAGQGGRGIAAGDRERTARRAHPGAHGRTAAGLSHRSGRRGRRERQGFGVGHRGDPGDVRHHAVHPDAAAA